jgi:hypothetical protein
MHIQRYIPIYTYKYIYHILLHVYMFDIQVASGKERRGSVNDENV